VARVLAKIAPFLLVLVSLTTGCGGNSASPESVVRAWSQSINSDDNAAAASLFARNARVIQSGRVLILRTRGDAEQWNASLSCSGKILSIKAAGATATAVFLLGDRRASRCDGPGSKATALFRVEGGKIVLWHQTAGTAGPGGTV
jgi:limonene-1,2-epoxide hydrolase